MSEFLAEGISPQAAGAFPNDPSRGTAGLRPSIRAKGAAATAGPVHAAQPVGHVFPVDGLAPHGAAPMEHNRRDVGDMAVVHAPHGAVGFRHRHKTGEWIEAVALEIEIPLALAAAEREADEKAALQVLIWRLALRQAADPFDQARVDGIVIVESSRDADLSGSFMLADFEQLRFLGDLGAKDRRKKGMPGRPFGHSVAVRGRCGFI